VPLGWPTQSDIETVVGTVAERVKRSLKARGLLVEGAREDEGASIELGGVADRTLANCYAAAMGGQSGRRATSPQEQDLFGRGDVPKGTSAQQRRRPELCARDNGFNLHAGVRIGAHMPDRLERLVRYLARPPTSDDRLKPTLDGRISVRLKTPYSDGTTHIVLTPKAFIQRLCALVPRPRAHRLRYHGVFAPASRFRAQVVPAHEVVTEREETPAGDERTSAEAQPTAVAAEDAPSPQCATPPIAVAKGVPKSQTRPEGRRTVRWILWAHLIQRVFGADPLVCPKCSKRMRILAIIMRADVIIKILACLDLPVEPPRMRPARGPPEEPDLDVGDLVEVEWK
jgi:hypothetical protein